MIEERWGTNLIVLLDDDDILALARVDPKELPSGHNRPRREFTIEIRASDHPKIDKIQDRCLEFIAERM